VTGAQSPPRRVERSAIHGFVVLESIDAFASPVDGATSFDYRVDFLVAGTTHELPSCAGSWSHCSPVQRSQSEQSTPPVQPALWPRCSVK
jgi:hypothetical protein